MKIIEMENKIEMRQSDAQRTGLVNWIITSASHVHHRSACLITQQDHINSLTLFASGFESC